VGEYCTMGRKPDAATAGDGHREDRERSITRSAASARSWCSASTTSTSRRPGITRWRLLKQEVMPRAEASRRGYDPARREASMSFRDGA